MADYSDAPEVNNQVLSEIEELLDGEDIFANQEGFDEAQEDTDTQSTKSSPGLDATPVIQISPFVGDEDITYDPKSRGGLSNRRVRGNKRGFGRGRPPWNRPPLIPNWMAVKMPGNSPVRSQKKLHFKPKDQLPLTPFPGEIDQRPDIEPEISKQTRKDIEKLLHHGCSERGLLPLVEYTDILVQRSKTKDILITEDIIDIFLAGVSIERSSSAVSKMSELMTSLTSEISRVQKIGRSMEETRLSSESMMKTNLEKNEDVLEKVVGRIEDLETVVYLSHEDDYDGLEQSLYMSQKDDSKGGPEKESNKKDDSGKREIKIKEEGIVIKKKGYLSKDSNLDRMKAGPSGVQHLKSLIHPDSNHDTTLYVLPEDDGRLEISQIAYANVDHLPIPVDLEEFYKTVVVTLGMPEDLWEDSRVQSAISEGLSTEEKLLVYYGKLDDISNEYLYEKVVTHIHKG